jgi:hypothetical protein
MANYNIQALLRDLGQQQSSLFEMAGASAGMHGIRDESALQKWRRSVGEQQLSESDRRQGRVAKQQKSGLRGAAAGYGLGEVIKFGVKKLFPQLEVADVLWKAFKAYTTYKGYQRGAKDVPYNYRGISKEGPRTTFGKPAFKDIASDIERINIQGGTMEALHSAAGEEMAQKLGMMLMPWGDIGEVATSVLPGGQTFTNVYDMLQEGRQVYNPYDPNAASGWDKYFDTFIRQRPG